MPSNVNDTILFGSGVTFRYLVVGLPYIRLRSIWGGMSTRMERVEEVLKRHGLTVHTSEDHIEARGYDRLDSRVWIRLGLHYDDRRRRLALDSVYEAKETVDNAIPSLKAFKHKTDYYRHTQYVRNLVGTMRREIGKTCGALLPYSGRTHPRHRGDPSPMSFGSSRSFVRCIHRLSVR
jgi:hypothetical protein